MTDILLLGATGSIGTSAVRIARQFPDRFRIIGMSANRNLDRLLELVKEFSPSWVHIGDRAAAAQAKGVLPQTTRLVQGREGLEEVASQAEYDILLNALVGEVGFRPTVAALRRKKRVALANKESLVIGGDLIASILDQGDGELIPVDSEHSAILQCLTGEHHDTIESIILTASGGPFRQTPISEFKRITPQQALNHPTWSMGPKITIDSATLINKGFEVIEAHYLFGVSYDRLRVVIHPQSIVHSMVEFYDGSIIAQMGITSMELPIQFALSFPQRLASSEKRLHLPEIQSLTFEEPNYDRFPCLRLCVEAGSAGGTAPAALNAANEIAVGLFLENRIAFEQISAIIQDTLADHSVSAVRSVEDVEAVDQEIRTKVLEQYGT